MGLVYLLGRPSLALYEPIRSRTGEVIGAFYVGKALGSSALNRSRSAA